MTPRAVRIVATDANVLIHLIHAGRLDLLARIPGHAFVVPVEVHEEVSVAEQRAALDAAVAAGTIALEAMGDATTLTTFAELTAHIGRGEAACLALAVRHGWWIASNEKRRFRREAVARLGPDRVLGTCDLFVLAIRANQLSVEEADADKFVLEQRRFRMPFASFRDLMRQG